MHPPRSIRLPPSRKGPDLRIGALFVMLPAGFTLAGRRADANTVRDPYGTGARKPFTSTMEAPMNAVVFGFLCILAMWVLVMVSPTGKRRRPGPSWFDILPHLTQSQKQKTRLQQTRRHGARRY